MVELLPHPVYVGNINKVYLSTQCIWCRNKVPTKISIDIVKAVVSQAYHDPDFDFSKGSRQMVYTVRYSFRCMLMNETEIEKAGLVHDDSLYCGSYCFETGLKRKVLFQVLLRSKIWHI